MTPYAKHFSTKETPQWEPIPGKNTVPNSAGGYSFPIDDWKRLDRFLILGSEGGSYYASEKKLTVENAQAVLRCLKEDGVRTVNNIIRISDSGRAAKNDAAIFALAMAYGLGDAKTKEHLRLHKALQKVCRTGTHLFQFIEAVENFRGHGYALNNALRNWYLEQSTQDLCYQVTKYRQRNGWSHRDILRLCKPKSVGPFHYIFKWIAKGIFPNEIKDVSLNYIRGVEAVKSLTNKVDVVKAIHDFGLVREHIPTQWLNEPEVWGALLEKMPLTAMIRNLATMTRVGLLQPMSTGTSHVIGSLTDGKYLKKSRVHPIQVLSALKTYARGHGDLGKNTWMPVPQVVDALDSAFYESFENVEPTHKRWLLGLDVSGSMWGGSVSGVPGLTPGVATGALAMVTARTERQYAITAFSHRLIPVTLSPKQRLDDVCKQLISIPMGGTDCSLPMLWALEQKIPVDVFAVYTDNETWAGLVHPVQALQKYRDKMGIPAKLIVNGMISNNFSIADSNDGGMLDVVGFDTATPQLMADFARE